MLVFNMMRLNSGRVPGKLLSKLGNNRILADLAMEKMERLARRLGGWAGLGLYHQDRELVQLARQRELEVVFLDPVHREKPMDGSLGPYRNLFDKLQPSPRERLLYFNPCMPFLRVTTLAAAVRRAEALPLPCRHATLFRGPVWSQGGTRIAGGQDRVVDSKRSEESYQVGHGFKILEPESYWPPGGVSGMFYSSLLITGDDPEFIDLDTPADGQLINWITHQEDWEAWWEDRPPVVFESLTFTAQEQPLPVYPQ